jgi:hypothetical protein
MKITMEHCWNGMEWNGVEWNGIEWSGVEWNDTDGVERKYMKKNLSE